MGQSANIHPSGVSLVRAGKLPNSAIFRVALAALLFFQVSVAYALPEGIHLNLCLSPNGQLEVSPDLCATGPSSCRQSLQPDPLLTAAAHDDCLEFILGCVSLGDLRPTGSLNCPIIKKIARGRLFVAAGHPAPPFPHPTATAATYGSRPLNSKTSPSARLASLRTIVLLI